jgi:hypothetical protein
MPFAIMTMEKISGENNVFALTTCNHVIIHGINDCKCQLCNHKKHVLV